MHSLPTPLSRPVKVAILNDYQLIVTGVAAMLAPYGDRVEVVQVDDRTLGSQVDIALLDMFAEVAPGARTSLGDVVRQGGPRVVVYTWGGDSGAAAQALSQGAVGYLSKTLPPLALVQALEDIHSGAVVTTGAHEVLLGEESEDPTAPEIDLSGREAEVLGLIAQGLSNKEIAQTLFLSVNSIKTYIRTAYAKIGVRSRSQAVVWALAHDCGPLEPMAGTSGPVGTHSASPVLAALG